MVKDNVDFKGQKKIEAITQRVLAAFLVASFTIGLIQQSLGLTWAIFLAGCAIVAIIGIPPWPQFKKNPVNWNNNAESPSPVETTPDSTTSNTKE